MPPTKDNQQGLKAQTGVPERHVHLLNSKSIEKPVQSNHLFFARYLILLNSPSKIKILQTLRERGEMNESELAREVYPAEDGRFQTKRLGKERNNVKVVLQGNFDGLVEQRTGPVQTGVGVGKGGGRNMELFSLNQTGIAFADTSYLTSDFFASNEGFRPDFLGRGASHSETSYKRALLLMKLVSLGELSQEAAVYILGTKLQTIDEYFRVFAEKEVGLITVIGKGMEQTAEITDKGMKFVGDLLVPIAEQTGFSSIELEHIKENLPAEYRHEPFYPYSLLDIANQSDLLGMVEQSPEVTREHFNRLKVAEIEAALAQLEGNKASTSGRRLLALIHQEQLTGDLPNTGKQITIEVGSRRGVTTSPEKETGAKKKSNLEFRLQTTLTDIQRENIHRTLEAYRAIVGLSYWKLADQLIPDDLQDRKLAVRNLHAKIQRACKPGGDIPTYDTLILLCSYFNISIFDAINGVLPRK